MNQKQIGGNMKRRLLGAATALMLVEAPVAHAAVTLMEKDDWKVTMNGFVETDYVYDTTRSFTEIIGNNPVARTSTLNGDNARAAFSDRNSRLGFSVYAPEQGGWKSKGVFEMDFLGNNNTGNSTSPENTTYASPLPRIRHAYFSTENDGWKFLSGQTWSLFGWQPYYFPTILTVAPAPGQLFQRSLQFMVMKDMHMGDSNLLQAGVSIERPSQRDAAMPNLNVGLRWALNSYRAVYASSYGDVNTEALSVGLSGAFRQFDVNAAGSSDTVGHSNGSAFAADVLIPIIPASDEKDRGNSLTLTAEFSAGSGYADALPGWTGGMTNFTSSNSGTSAATRTAIDAGFGGFDSTGNTFTLVNLQTYNVTLQYMLPESMRSWVTAGYSELMATNMGTFANATNGTVANMYDKTSMYFVNFNHDFSNQIRAGLEWDKVTTRYYTDGADPYNNRIQITALYRF
jgi:hypothetical protein